ncbi:MAG: hypothetical protein WBV94_33930 [Blastocatellia bacterium]
MRPATESLIFVLRSLFCFSLVCLSISRQAQAQANEWASIGPSTGLIADVVIDPLHPGTVYAYSSNGGIFKTIDGGTDWSVANRGLDLERNLRVTALAIDRKDTSIIYAGTDNAILKSVDSGANWVKVRQMNSICSLALDPSNSRILYAGRSPGGIADNIFKSTDGGATWIAVKNQFGIKQAESIVVISSKTAGTVIYAATNKGVIKSTDGGANWTLSTSGMLDTWTHHVAADSSNPSVIYAATNKAFFKSVDGGTNWTGINSGLPGESYSGITISPTHTDTIFAAIFRHGIYKSTDGGARWTKCNAGFDGLYYFNVAIDPSNENVMYAGSGNGVFKSANGGARWAAVNAGIHSLDLEAIAVARQDAKIIYAGDTREYVYKTTNGGLNWARAYVGDVSFFGLTIDPSNSDIVYAATTRGVYKSVDGGESWRKTNPDLQGVFVFVYTIAVDPSNNSTIYAGITEGGAFEGPNNGIFKSVDGGSKWKKISNGLEQYYAEAIAVDPTNPNIIYAGAGHAVFKSTDGGANWINLDTGPKRLRVGAIVIDPSNTDTVFVGTEDGIFKTTNGGTDWRRFEGLRVSSLAIDPSASNVIYAGTSKGVFMSSDRGENWSRAKLGLPDVHVQDVAIDPSDTKVVYAATRGRSVFKRRFVLMQVSSVVFGNGTLVITGQNFGRSPRVIINGVDKTKLIADVSDTRMQLNGYRDDLNLEPRESTVLVIGSDGTGSSLFILKR